jgi:hypothetical protein
VAVQQLHLPPSQSQFRKQQFPEQAIAEASKKSKFCKSDPGNYEYGKEQELNCGDI